MKAMVCSACGSNELEDHDGFYLCPYCGTRFEKEKTQDSASLEKDSQIQSMLAKADMYWRHGMKAQARRTYQLVLELDASCSIARERL